MARKTFPIFRPQRMSQLAVQKPVLELREPVACQC